MLLKGLWNEIFDFNCFGRTKGFLGGENRELVKSFFAISGADESNKKQRKYKNKAQLNDFISQTTIIYWIT